MAAVRTLLADQLDHSRRKAPGLSPLNTLVCVLILVSALLTMVETEDSVRLGHEGLFDSINLIFNALFLAEYLIRLWVCVENPKYQGPLLGRLRYALTPAALIDLLAIVPSLLIPTVNETLLLRIFRVLRILRLARLGRFTHALGLVSAALRERRFELLLTLMAAAFLLVLTSTLLYLVEGGVQPEAFGSIPRAMWWSIATLTTVGYGDVYPITALGRTLAALTAITGIGLIAMPTGILAAAFSSAMQHRRDAAASPPPPTEP
ncbi:MAG: ion transporter [Pseudomonas sp.]|uniref:ion transporter n=1 Tax=Pseudomonas sp. TaxID=306 RepID=UPI0033957CAA